MGFRSCRADPDVWYRPDTKVNGFEYYEYILTYVDDCLIVSSDPKKIIDILQDEYKYKLKDVGEPKRYLGAEIGKYDFSDGILYVSHGPWTLMYLATRGCLPLVTEYS
jgi:hypothetical protein